MTDHVLDNPGWAALTGPHARFAETYGRAARYHPDVSLISALADPADPACWRDLAVLAGPGAEVIMPGTAPPPPTWATVSTLGGLQFVGDRIRGEPDPEAVRLGSADVPEILDLVARTDPGPFRKRTIELGVYLGIRRAGRLVAMAGERSRPPGWTEVSAVCTDPAHRGSGLGTRLVRAIVAGIHDHGDQAFLHSADTNTTAIRLYQRLGFTLRKPTRFSVFRTPAR